MFDVALTIRDNGEWLKPYLLSYKKYTSNFDRTIYITYTSTIENKKNIEDIISLFPDLNIKLYHGDRSIHYHKTWVETVEKSERTFVLLTHTDTVYLMKDWDIALNNQIKNGNTLVSVSVRTKKYPESVWICADKGIFISSKFDHSKTDNKTIEHGKIKVIHDKTSEGSLYINNFMSVPKYGDIAIYEDKEFIYHNYYSSRIKEDNQCPVPLGSETSYLEQREDFTKTINKIEQYLLNDRMNTLHEHLIDNT
jgi:hypothetical protein